MENIDATQVDKETPSITIHKDPKTQRRYSYNALTGETEWLTEAGKKILETNDVQTTLKEFKRAVDEFLNPVEKKAVGGLAGRLAKRGYGRSR